MGKAGSAVLAYRQICCRWVSREPRAGQSRFRDCLEAQSRLAQAHHLLTPLEVDVGQARHAMVRLLQLAKERPGDAELFAGLVHACRYCGLLAASTQADAYARRIDSRINTSVVQTRFHKGEYSHVALLDVQEFPIAVGSALLVEGRNDEAALRLESIERSEHRLRDFAVALRALALGKRSASLEVIAHILDTGFRAPEELYHLARLLARLDAPEQALATLVRSIDGGFYPFQSMQRDPWLEPLHGAVEFSMVLENCGRLHREAAGLRCCSRTRGARAFGRKRHHDYRLRVICHAASIAAPHCRGRRFADHRPQLIDTGSRTCARSTRRLRQFLRLRFHFVAQPPHYLSGPADVGFTEIDADRRDDSHDKRGEVNRRTVYQTSRTPDAGLSSSSPALLPARAVAS